MTSPPIHHAGGGHEAGPLLPWILTFLRPYRGRVAAIAVLAVVEIALAALAPWPLKLVVDNVLEGLPLPDAIAPLAGAFASSPAGLLLLIVAAGLLLQIAAEAVVMCHTQLQVSTGQRIVYDLRSTLIAHLQSLPLRHHITGRTADSVYRLEADAYCVDDLVMGGVFPLAIAFIKLGVMFFILLRLDAALALLSLAVVPFLYASLRYYALKMTDRAERVKTLESSLIGRAFETLSSIRAVKSFARERHEQERFSRAAGETMQARLRLTWQESLFSVTVTGITLTGTALVLAVGGLHVLDGTLTIGSLLVVIAYLAAVYNPLSAIAHTSGSLQQALVSARRVREILALIPEPLDDDTGTDAAGIAGHVSFKNVGFAYDDGHPILEDVSFDARPGEMVALVGLTGAGKTTLTSLVPRLFEPTHGQVLIDDLEASRYNLRSLRERIALVPQEPVLFTGTIRDNIRYGRLDATDGAIEEAARAAQVHQFVERLPDGYDTEVAEAGATLSGGERQRLGIARALLKDAPILILDEPTSSLDAISEEAVFEAVRHLRKGRTTLVIAHRLSTIRDADRILVLHEGRLLAQGTHDELLKNNELYRRMCARLSIGRSLEEQEWLDELRNTLGVKILFAGIIARYPYGGVTWCSLMYMLGLRALGHDVYYVEDTGECIYDPEQDAQSLDPSYGTRYIHDALEPFGLGDRWSFVNYDGSYHGGSRETVHAWCRDAELYINLSGGSWFWRDEYARIPRKVFVDSDPVFTQLAIAKGEGWYVDFFRGFDRLFTFGANIGTTASDVPTGAFTWHHTWQPVVIDLWETADPPAHDRFTTVMTWKIESFTDVDGNKDREFIKFIDLPARTAQTFELAVNGPQQLLQAHGWSTVDAMSVSRSLWDYRTFIQGSKAEFGVAKHAYVSRRSGWFSDRTECYLAAGRPALVQDTGWSNYVPAGEGLMGFSTPDEALEGIARLDCDYDRHARGARTIAREHFDAARVLPPFLEVACG